MESGIDVMQPLMFCADNWTDKRANKKRVSFFMNIGFISQR